MTQSLQRIKVDLHGLNHPEAKREVEKFLNENWGSNQEVEIITGHSQRMKGVVMNLLDEYGLTYSMGYLYEKNGPRLITWLE